MSHSDSLQLIFVKHPVPGKVKTRLGATLGHDTAVAIYQELLAYTCKITQALEADKAVWYGNDYPETDLWEEAGYERFPQTGPDLGARMQEAFEWGFGRGYKKIQIIGSDCAALTTDILAQGLEILEQSDFVVGPAKDGGYYLIGMNAPYYQVFKDKEWSTEHVLPETIRDLREGKKMYRFLPTLSDIDHEADLKGTFLERFLPANS
ncbi:MAG: TIGR04282 family arsenosugar biosynthesis glycosyltransferase [Bacteroidota bacterium]